MRQRPLRPLGSVMMNGSLLPHLWLHRQQERDVLRSNGRVGPVLACTVAQIQSLDSTLHLTQLPAAVWVPCYMATNSTERGPYGQRVGTWICFV